MSNNKSKSAKGCRVEGMCLPLRKVQFCISILPFCIRYFLSWHWAAEVLPLNFLVYPCALRFHALILQLPYACFSQSIFNYHYLNTEFWSSYYFRFLLLMEFIIRSTLLLGSQFRGDRREARKCFATRWDTLSYISDKYDPDQEAENCRGDCFLVTRRRNHEILVWCD